MPTALVLKNTAAPYLNPQATADGVALESPLRVGSGADVAGVKGIHVATAVAVAVPSITDPDSASVDVDVAAAFTMQPAVGDLVLVCPEAALPANAFLSSAYITATDTVRMVFTSIGGSVTGASRNFTVMVFDVT